jgi:DNA-binding NtrC family response regulator
MSELDMDLSGSRVLVVDDVPANLDVLCQSLETAGYRVMVASSGEVALKLVERSAPDLILLDVVMPGIDGFETCRRLKQAQTTRQIPVIFLTARDDTTALAEGFRAGGVDYVVKPFQKEEVLIRLQTHLERSRLAQALAEKHTALKARTRELEEEIARRQALTRERNHLSDHLSHLSQREAARWGLHGFVGQSQTLRAILDEVGLLQTTQHLSVLILGESGTGKELIARAIHKGSARHRGPFVAVNCAAIPRDLAESLFFGHLKGAFSGAERDQAGYFELAHGGTLFLDEVGTMPADLQPKLLRVLEDGLVQPLGSRQARQVEVRVLAATNADLLRQIQEGRFRQDLYYRLARFTVRVPPLRERREDIPLLASHFLQLLAAEMGIEHPALSPAALDLLEKQDFPGNIRELKNVVERALIESRGKEIRPEHLHLAEAAPPAPSPPELPLNLEQAEQLLIQRALERTGGNVSEAARLLGIDRNKIYRRLDRPTS